MKSSLRLTSPDDLRTIRQFLAAAFETSEDVPFLNPAVMSWKYWDQRSDWEGPRSYVIEKDGAVLAHAGLWPVVFGAPGDSLHGVQMIDWAGAKGSPGSGVTLVQKLAGMFEFIYSIGGSAATQKVLPALGFTQCTTQWKAVQPLRPIKQILTHQDRTWKLLPRLARNIMWAARPSSAHADGWSVKLVAPADIRCEAPEAAASILSMPRPAEFFDYLLRCPAARCSLFALSRQGEYQGHLVLCVVRGQARLGGLWLRTPSPERLATAYRMVVSAAKALPDAYELVTSGSGNGAHRKAVEQTGFRMLPGPPVFLLDRRKKLNLPNDFQFQFADDDQAFLDNGTADYWS